MNAEELFKAETELYKQSFYHFTKYCLGYKDLNRRVHGEICDEMQNKETKRKLICVPRGTFKSSIGAVAYPMWSLLPDPNLRVLIDSSLYSNSKNFLRETKAHYKTNETFRAHFGDWVGNECWNEGEIIVSRRTKPLKEPSIACSGIGAQKTSQHYDLIVADDLSGTDNVKTPELAQKVIDHYRLYTSLLEPNGTIVIIGTRYSELDIIGHILENELGVTVNDLLKIDGRG